jgi:hypothetical protein
MAGNGTAWGMQMWLCVCDMEFTSKQELIEHHWKPNGAISGLCPYTTRRNKDIIGFPSRTSCNLCDKVVWVEVLKEGKIRSRYGGTTGVALELEEHTNMHGEICRGHPDQA